MTTAATIKKHPKVMRQAQRVRALREMTCLSRRAFSRKHGIPLGTLQNWEEGRYGELSQAVINRLLGCYAKENIFVTDEWIAKGKGSRPGSTFETNTKISSKKLTKSSNTIAEELKVFHELNTGAVDFIVPDSTMMPCYEAGDLVAGIRVFGNDMDTLVGRFCIVQKKSGETLIREIKKGTQKGCYDLLALHKRTKPEKNQSLFSAAAIVWVRKLN